MKNTLIWGIVLVVIVLGAVLLFRGAGDDAGDRVEDSGDSTGLSDQNSNATKTTATTTGSTTVDDKPETVIGKSAGGNNIVVYHFGAGEKEILFVGGIHGGYSPNTVQVATLLVDYFTKNPAEVPSNLKITIVPTLNPDGFIKIAGSQLGKEAGRFNDNDVDLNRNFDCDWQAIGKWQTKDVSGGTSAFSEPESLAIKNYIETRGVDAVLVWYAAAGGVFASNCHDGVLPKTTELTNAFARASGYPAYNEFNFYEVTGDMTNWLAKEGIPAISVLLTDHSSVEWEKNLAGIKAFITEFVK